jgi:hypothetical protein
MPKDGLGRRIEQLHYTWAPRGAEGINRFQISGISAGLKRSPLVSLLPDLRRLCRYDRPRGANAKGPASFGWLDLQQHRVAFLRVPVPGTGGRSGSFAAHLLVGPPASLSPGEIASSFGAGFWWTGLTDGELDALAAGKRDFELPQLDWGEALETRVPVGEVADAAGVLALDLLSLSDGERLAVLDDGAEFGPALRTLGWQFPQALGGISLSTFEAAPIFQFTVVGTSERPSRMRLCELADDRPNAGRSATAQELLGDRPAGRLLRAALGHSVKLAQGQRSGTRGDLARTLVALATGVGVDPSPLTSHANPEAIAYLAHSEPGRERLVEIATAGSPQLLVTLSNAQKLIPRSHLDELCRAFGRHFAARGDPRGCAEVLAAFPASPARAKLEKGVLTIALRSELPGDAIPAEDTLALLRIATARNLDVERCQPLLQSAARHLGACADDDKIPKSMLIAMLPIAIDEGGTENELCRALQRHPSLLIGNLSDPAQEESWLSLGCRLSSPHLEEALPALLGGLGRRRREDLTALLSRVPKRAGWRSLAIAGYLFDRGALPPSLVAICEEWATTALEDDDLEMARRLLAHGSSRDAKIAAALLASLRPTTAAAVYVGNRVGEIQKPALRGAVFNAVLSAAISGLRHPDEARLTWTLLTSSLPDATTETKLELLLRRATQAPSASGQAVLLAWLSASFLPAHDDLRKRDGQPKSRSVADLASTLAPRMSSLEIERLEPFVNSADRRARRCWKSLVSECRKAHDPRRR